MGTTTIYRLVSRHRPAPAPTGDTVLGVHGQRDLALGAFSRLARDAGDTYGPWSQHQLVLLPEQVRR